MGTALKMFEAKGSMVPSAIAAIRLLMLTGCRTDEILTLKWDDVDRTARVLRLRDTKTGPRMVPLTGPVLNVLDGIERAEGFPGYYGARSPIPGWLVFPRTGEGSGRRPASTTCASTTCDTATSLGRWPWARACR